MRTQPWDWAHVGRVSLVAVPVGFGIWSMLLGADANWDLFNYHLYNPFSLLHDKLEVDFAPAGLQTYFNPLLDLPYFLAITHLPGPLVGFLMGALHGANFVLLHGICRSVLARLGTHHERVAVLLALAGCLTANFLSELGNTMGDNTTALLCLASILVVLRNWDRLASPDRHAMALVVLSGLMAGLAAGLKLTNAVYVVAFWVGIAAIPALAKVRVHYAVLFAAGAATGIVLGAGYWLHKMWEVFANPLFPQFGSLFPNPLVASGLAVDTRWLPQGWAERLTWPFIISLDARRAGHLAIRQVLWALAYVLLIAWAIASIANHAKARRAAPMDSAAVYLVVVLAVGFFVWMNVFSLYRYLVTAELLLPLGIYLLATHVLPFAPGERLAAAAIFAATLFALSGMKTWGHAPWADEPFTIETPRIADPAKSTVLLVGGDPWAWVAVGFPRSLSLVQVGGNFPEGPGFKPRVVDLAAVRGGPVFALVTGHYDSAHERGRKLRRIVDASGLTQSESGCAFLRWAAALLRNRFETRPGPGTGTCEWLPRIERSRNIDEEDRVERHRAGQLLSAYGFALSGAACSKHSAWLSGERRMFQWCAVTVGS